MIDETDRRMEYLSSYLSALGHYVTNNPEEISEPCNVVLSPALRGEKLTHIAQNMSCCGTLFCGGDDSVYDICLERGITYVNFAENEVFLQKNADATAEAAISIIISETERVLSACDIAIVGFGRIASALAKKLSTLGANVLVFCSGKHRIAQAAAMGINAELYSRLPELLANKCMLINTVPSFVITNAAVDASDSCCIMLELASAPYGFSHEYARATGRRVISGGGLPAKYSPQSAALYMLDVITDCLEVGTTI